MAPRYYQNTFTLVPNPMGMQGLVARSRMTAAARGSNAKSRPGTGDNTAGTGDNSPDLAPAPVQSKPPMTSKQAQKLYRKQTRLPKVSREEQRRLDRLAQEAIRKELEKEKAASKARAARERKKEKEQQARDARKRKGMPLVDVRPSQDTIARFVRLGGETRGTKRDADGREKEGEASVTRLASDRVLETLAEEENEEGEEGEGEGEGGEGGGGEEGIIHDDQETVNNDQPLFGHKEEGEPAPRPKRAKLVDAEDAPCSRQEAIDRAPSSGKAIMPDSQTGNGPTASQRSQGSQGRDGTVQPSPGCSYPQHSSGKPAGRIEPSPTEAKSLQHDGAAGQQEAAERPDSTMRLNALHLSQTAARNTGSRDQDCQAITHQKEENIFQDREQSTAKDGNKPQSSQHTDSVKKSGSGLMEPPPHPVHTPVIERLDSTTRSAQEKPQPLQGPEVRPLLNVRPSIPPRNARPASATAPRTPVPRFTVTGPATSRVPSKSIPPVPCFKKPSSGPSRQGTAKPRFLPRHIRTHPAPPAPRSSGLRSSNTSVAPPSSTQLFVMSHLDDFFPSPTQEARELEEIDRTLSSAPHAPPKKPATAVMAAATSTSVPPRPSSSRPPPPPPAFPVDSLRNSVPKHTQQSKPPNSPRAAVLPTTSSLLMGEASSSLEMPFMSTQDFMSSQDVRELESLMPNVTTGLVSGNNGGRANHAARQRSRLPPPALDPPTSLASKTSLGGPAQRQQHYAARSQSIRRPLHVAAGAQSTNNPIVQRSSQVSREKHSTHQTGQASLDPATNPRETTCLGPLPCSNPRRQEVPTTRAKSLIKPTTTHVRVSTPQSILSPGKDLSQARPGDRADSNHTPHSSTTSSSSSSSPPKKRLFTSSGHMARLLVATEQSKRSYRQEEHKRARERLHCRRPMLKEEPKKNAMRPRNDGDTSTRCCSQVTELAKENVPPSKNTHGIDEDELSAILGVVDGDEGGSIFDDDNVALDLGLVPVKKSYGGALACEMRTVIPSTREDKTRLHQVPTAQAPSRPPLQVFNQNPRTIPPEIGKPTIAMSSSQKGLAKAESKSFGLSQEDFGADLDGLDLSDLEIILTGRPASGG